MAGYRQEVHPQAVYRRRDFPHRLGCIGMKQDTLFTGDFSDLGQRLNRPDLIIGMHDADENSFACDGPAHRLRVNAAGTVNRQKG